MFDFVVIVLISLKFSKPNLLEVKVMGWYLNGKHQTWDTSSLLDVLNVR